MTNLPYRIGDRYRCFTVTKRDRGWGGPYGQYRREVEWTCTECGSVIRGDGSWSLARMADHHECGHAPCAYCGQMLLRRKDGTPRQHAANRCPGKTRGHLIVREFEKNVREREYT